MATTLIFLRDKEGNGQNNGNTWELYWGNYADICFFSLLLLDSSQRYDQGIG